MTGHMSDSWEEEVSAIAHRFVYPPTPDIAGRLWAEPRTPPRLFLLPRAAWIGAALLIALVLAVPQARASLWEWVQVGAIRARLWELEHSEPAAVPPALIDLAGETTLAEARERSPMPVRLPTYPPGLGQPDRIYLQDMEGAAVVLVWLDPENPEEVWMSLHSLEADFWGEKTAPLLEETTVNGERALWVHGPHFLVVGDSSGTTAWQERRLVEGNVLIWVEAGITYRLESKLPLDAAVRVAESLE